MYRDLTRMTIESCSILQPGVELHSKLTTIPFMVISVTSYLGLHNVITSYDGFRCVSTKIKWFVWTLYNINDIYLVILTFVVESCSYA